jgi:hypothetical protein
MRYCQATVMVCQLRAISGSGHTKRALSSPRSGAPTTAAGERPVGYLPIRRQIGLGRCVRRAANPCSINGLPCNQQLRGGISQQEARATPVCRSGCEPTSFFCRFPLFIGRISEAPGSPRAESPLSLVGSCQIVLVVLTRFRLDVRIISLVAYRCRYNRIVRVRISPWWPNQKKLKPA